MTNKVYVGDVGTEIILECTTDISTATAHHIQVMRPDGVEVEWITSIEGTTKLKYTALEGDFDMEGEYMLQAYVELPTWKGLGETVILTVHPEYN